MDIYPYIYVVNIDIYLFFSNIVNKMDTHNSLVRPNGFLIIYIEYDHL
jgi:hypothetical protein